MQAIKKAVFPVAGLGTRFLPATKATPKEMLPIVDKPLIQYAVEEAVEAGITDLIFVTSSSKRAIEDHFDSHYELEHKLADQKKIPLLKIVQDVLPKGVNVCYVRQSEALGLGHAVLCAQSVVGDEPFAVLLADDLIHYPKKGCLKQMVEEYQASGHSLVAVEKIPAEHSRRYGVVDVLQAQRVMRMQGIVEKPAAEDAPSPFGVVGRYLLSSEIFTLLKETPRGSGGEIQLTDAIEALLKTHPVSAFAFDGKRFDCGSKLGYLEATLQYALHHPEIGKSFEKVLQQYSEERVCISQ